MLPEHLESMHTWLDLVDEVVVVDSKSTDGSLELLKSELSQSNCRFFTRPKGLYQSWNYGISQIKSRYTYISTIGDAMTREGLQHLYTVASSKQADVVISPPRFIDEAGQHMAQWQWPINELIELLEIDSPSIVDRWTLFIFGFLAIPNAILGSSASNLYRSAVLQDSPFPTEHGTGGDGAWFLERCLDIRVAITPREVSTFRQHEKAYNPSQYAVADRDERLRQLVFSSLETASTGDKELARELRSRGIVDILREAQASARCRQALNNIRKTSSWPWYFHPQAWRLRWGRDRFRRNEQKMLADIASEYAALKDAR